MGSRILLHLDLLLLLVDEQKHTFPVPKLLDVVCDEPVKPSVSGQCASVALVPSLLLSTSPLSSVDKMNMQTVGALRLGRRFLTRYYGDTSPGAAPAVEETTPPLDPVRDVTHCLEVMTHHGWRERSWEEMAAGCQEIPMENWLRDPPIQGLFLNLKTNWIRQNYKNRF